MGKRGPTKSQAALDDVKVRIDAVKEAYDAAVADVSRYSEKLELLTSVYAGLQRNLAPKSRTNGSKPPKRAAKAAATAMTEVVQGLPACATCGKAEGDSNHDMAYLSSHPFLASNSAPRAAKKSLPKKLTAALPAPSSAINSATVTGAVESGVANEHIT